MSKLYQLIISERGKDNWYSKLSNDAISRIAAKCGRDEIAEAHIKLKYFKSELMVVPDWDGDTQDDIWRAIELFRAILAECNK
ncbi:hypothetical protein DYB39_09190 [Providencia rettgeri]|jgi:hypothetical protein|uniref:hypothetical protein n=1 Tax=Providencia rettgeri TaxID=587 RepID=UPI000E3D78D5|nr:hypothetical protein [Providencia rettgeri]RFT11132.1 hypothetical protein DYB39_09190 [Providencia rettgeri]